MRQKSSTATFLAVGAVTVLLLASVACQSSHPAAEAQAPPTQPSRPADTSAERTSPAMLTLLVPTLSPESVVAAELDAEKAVATAKAALIVRLAVAEETIVVRAVEAVQWDDSSLGCPRPDMTYTQAVTPGFRVVLEVQGQAYEYHTDAGRLVILCGSGDVGP